MLLGALVAWFLPRVQYGKHNENEKLEHLGRGPPPRAQPTVNAEQYQQQGDQQGQGNLATEDVPPRKMQQLRH